MNPAVEDSKTRSQMIIVGMGLVIAALLAYIVVSRRSEAPPISPASIDTAAASAKGADGITREIALTEEAQKESGIATVLVESAAPQGAIAANGQIALNDNATWHVGAQVDGKVTHILAAVGDRIKSGQVLAYLHSHSVHETRAAYAQAKAEMDRSKSHRDLAARNAERARRLFQLQAISQEQMESAGNDLRAAETMVRKAEADVTKERTHLAEFLEVNPDGGPAAPGVDEDAVPIRAPHDGTVTRRLVNNGTVMATGQEAFTIADLGHLWIIAAVNEADLSAVRPGVGARITVRAFPERTFPGRVLQLGEEMDANTRTLKVRIAVDSPGELLKPEMFAQVEIDKPGGPAGIFITDSAVEEVDGKRIAFVQSAAGRFRARVIETGAATGNRQIEVKSGLNAGDRVVIKGAFLLKSELLKSRLEGE